MRRCALCGRHGYTRYEQAPAAMLWPVKGRETFPGTAPVVMVDVCRSVPACRRRRGLPA